LAGDSQATIVTHDSAHSGAGFNAVRRGVLKTDFFENAEDIVDDCGEGYIREGLVATAALPGPHGFHRFL
jgi:hypothetical protein